MTISPVGAEERSVYKADVDQAMSSRCGVTYSHFIDMTAAMDPRGAMIDTASAQGLDPAKFARAFQRAHGLTALTADASPAERADAETHNLHRAAVIAFGTDSRLWDVGTDGRAYLALEGNAALQLDVLKRSGKWGFVVSDSRGEAPLDRQAGDPLGRITPPTCEFVPVAARMDVGDTVTAAVHLRAQRRSAALSAPVPTVHAEELEHADTGMRPGY
jgi:hypothetical protein